MGYGTQFALADLEEGTRIVDSPVVDVKAALKAAPTASVVATPAAIPVAASTAPLADAPKKSAFRKAKAAGAAVAATPANNDAEEWT